jgi:hypothetical protein
LKSEFYKAVMIRYDALSQPYDIENDVVPAEPETPSKGAVAIASSIAKAITHRPSIPLKKNGTVSNAFLIH